MDKEHLIHFYTTYLEVCIRLPTKPECDPRPFYCKDHVQIETGSVGAKNTYPRRHSPMMHFRR